MFAPRYDSNKLKLNLKLANVRLANLQKKMENQGILARKEIAQLLDKGKEELARIKVEQIVRDDYLVEAYELLEMYCSLLASRFGLIDSVKACDEGIREAVCTVLWATPRVQADVTEFRPISQQLALRYGREFAEQALATHSGVNERVMYKLNVHQPERRIVDGYLHSIAQTYKVAWAPAAELPPLPPPPPGTGGHNGSGMAYPPPQQQQQQPFQPQQYAPQPPAAGLFAAFPSPPTVTAAAAAPVDSFPSVPQLPKDGAFPPPPATTMYPPPQAVDPSAGTLPGYASGVMAAAPEVTAPPPAAPAAAADAGPPDFDELTRRFNALRRQ